MDLKANFYLFLAVLFSLFLISGILAVEEEIENQMRGLK